VNTLLLLLIADEEEASNEIFYRVDTMNCPSVGRETTEARTDAMNFPRGGRKLRA